MTEVENLIYEHEGPQREILLFFHRMLTMEFSFTDKITFKNPCYYNKSWICYLKPLKNGRIEFAFLRGNELSNSQGLLHSGGRKQLRSIEFATVEEIPVDTMKEILHEAVLPDETTPYESKRKQKKK